MRKAVVLLIAITLFVRPVISQEREKPLVVTSLPPVASIIKEALGDSVEVVYLVPPGVEPHQYQLSPEQIALLKNADVIVTTGHLPAENKIIELKSEGSIEGIVLEPKDYSEYGFKYLPERWYEGKNNPHGTWLDPMNALAIAKATAVALSQLYPEKDQEFSKAFERFEEKVTTIIKAYSSIAKDKKAIIELPSQQYALEWLGIEVISSIKPEAEGPAKSIDELSTLRPDIIVYDENTPDVLKNAAYELSNRLGVPLANITVLWTDKNYTEVLIQNSKSVIGALKEEKKVVVKEGNEKVQYIAISLLTGLIVGVSIGVVIRKCPVF
ncbi:ABC transporter substrate-binding protein [Pyrococcus furiosus DSM 3638]|uniref:ABC transporter substrate-binding protein n=3 Tax=Pyrococcus furiosus TaxID=2261 RepID=A0A5C0XNC6_PYRFU|nr:MULTISPECIES: zinc ABC transporter substrate-binding protein [Pyrococcus]AAL80497.1 putative ABC transporter, periplasmic binding protein [Pyrococcus furiosus DSM 3638]AFN03153.1 ABC transporter periplasmic binding protein [Pyrococcus furiosus COM1]MDK2869978.1 zinc/manganese transport system substrate-binding protein [Pyrococcus sp.]QEK78081.1 ABC transporter substrate-binding protein [Pyrococcus furiosus DSM 3638]